MNCWNVRTFSWIVAILHVVISAIISFALITVLCLPESEKAKSFENYEREKNYLLFLHISLLLYCLALLACAITLIVGLKKNRYQLLIPFIYVAYVGILGNLIISGRMFIWGIRHKRAFGALALDLFTDVLIAAIQAMLITPVYMRYKQLLSTPSRSEPQVFNNNDAVSKPYTIQGGQI